MGLLNGIYHKTLQNAEVAIKKGTKAKALRIIETHIAEEHHLNSDMSTLMQNIGRFQNDINSVRNLLNIKHPEAFIKERQNMLRLIDDARHALNVIHITARDLVKEIKFEE